MTSSCAHQGEVSASVPGKPMRSIAALAYDAALGVKRVARVDGSGDLSDVFGKTIWVATHCAHGTFTHQPTRDG